MVTNQISLTAGSVFVVSARNGDIHLRTKEGLYASDTRFLSAFRLSVQGEDTRVVRAGIFHRSMASFYVTPKGTQYFPTSSISIVRDRYVDQGLHEDINVANHATQPRTVHLELTFDADFADVFEVRVGHFSRAGRVTVEEREGQHLCLTCQGESFHRETWISFSEEPLIRGKTAIFDIVLQPKESWKTCVTVLPVAETTPPPMNCVATILGTPFGSYHYQEKPPLSMLTQTQDQQLLKIVPTLQTNHEGLQLAYHQAIADLSFLLMEHLPGHRILAAGFPWFMTVFGRDSIISAFQTKLLGPELMLGTLHTLANLQAVVQDDFREAEPGKIPHEVRRGELSVLEEVPHSRYYGTIDATPLFLVLLHEAYQWTGDLELLHQLLPAAEAALQWIDRYGDLDGDGFLEYKRRTKHGLRNQGWKDSGDSISFAEGTLAQGPIALAEVQGYVYDAKRKMAQLYRVLGDTIRADQLEHQAERLKAQFNKAFWMPEQGYFALALDGRKRQVDSIASNAGQCLWSGIVDSEKASQVVERLMAPDMFSGWGIRTLSTEMSRYNPLSYHNGSVWPHDTSLIAAGMGRYGFAKEARKVALALVDATVAFPEHHLPELFAGYPRREFSFPVPYPGTNAPQAWASGAVIYLLETFLGVLPAGDRLLQEAQSEGLLISLTGIIYRGSRRISSNDLRKKDDLPCQFMRHSPSPPSQYFQGS
jgi:glycogen debranching enzyme